MTEGFLHLGEPATGRGWARQWTERLRPRAASDTRLRDDLFYCGAVLGAVLLNDPLARIGLATRNEPIRGSFDLFEALQVLTGTPPFARL